MKHLRRAIRRILLENTQHYDKIVKLVMTCDSENVNTALMLGEIMGYLEIVSYDTDEVQPYWAPGTHGEKEPVTKHRWEILPHPELLEKLDQGWKDMGYDRPIFGVSMRKKAIGANNPNNWNIGYVIIIVDKPSKEI